MPRKSKARRPRTVTQSTRAGITFPVGRVGRYMRRGKWSQRTGAGAPVFLAAVLEYVCAEVLEVSGDLCRQSVKQRLMPRHIELACRNDADLARFFQNKSFANGGVTPYVNPKLLKKK